MKKDDPALKGPFDVKFKEGLIHVEVAGDTAAAAGGADQDVIVVIDSDETYRKDISTIFEGLARVEAYGGCRGRSSSSTRTPSRRILMILDVYLGDGTFIDVLAGIKADEKAANISTIVVHPTARTGSSSSRWCCRSRRSSASSTKTSSSNASRSLPRSFRGKGECSSHHLRRRQRRVRRGRQGAEPGRRTAQHAARFLFDEESLVL